MLTPSALERAFHAFSAVPTSVAAMSVADARFDALEAADRDLAERWHPDRRQSFAAGRACARRALSDWSWRPPRVDRDARGAPVVPTPYKLSISHSRQFAVACATVDNGVLGLGVDIEEGGRVSHEMTHFIVNDEEFEDVRQGRLKSDEWATVIFSAKESVYKSVYPLVRKVFDFKDVTLNFDEDRFGVQLSSRIGLERSVIVEGRFLVLENCIATICTAQLA
jgi:4'-phosphopantetheinyl transferase EntD